MLPSASISAAGMGGKRPGKEQITALQLCINTKHHSAIVDVDKKRLFSDTNLSTSKTKPFNITQP